MTNLTLYLRLIRAILVLLVAKLWESIWKRGCSEVKCGNCVSELEKKTEVSRGGVLGEAGRLNCLMVY